MKVLLVEDDPDLALTTRRLLGRHNYVVDHADCLSVGKAALQDNRYDIVLLDRRLPDGEGTDLIRFARSKGLQTRFLILSALGDLDQRIEGLDIGADEYMVKPFEPDELLARMRAAERRPLPDTARIIEVGKLRLNQDTHNVRISGETVTLPRRELIILEALMARAGRVVTRDALEAAMYGYDEEIQSNTLESHVSRLRKNLATRIAGVAIITVRGVGYMLKVEE